MGTSQQKMEWTQHRGNPIEDTMDTIQQKILWSQYNKGYSGQNLIKSAVDTTQQ